MHLLLGKSYEGTGSYDLSTEQFRQALVYDVYCHEAFDKIIGHHLLTASQGMRSSQAVFWLIVSV